MVGVESVKWKKGVVLFHNRTMHVTGNITRGMPEVLARESRPAECRQGSRLAIDRGKTQMIFSFVLPSFPRFFFFSTNIVYWENFHSKFEKFDERTSSHNRFVSASASARAVLLSQN